MPNRSTTIKQSEIARALKSAQTVGLAVASYEVDQIRGTIRVFTEGNMPRQTGDDIDGMIENFR